MQQERYNLTFTQQYLAAEFKSEGPNGIIIKTILFQETLLTNVFNLAFGDKYTDSEDFDDTAITNNGDTQTVLATVAYAVQVFTEKFPDSWIIAKGSTASRNRLYQMGINKYFEELKTIFDLIAESEESWEEYQKGRNYLAFAIRRKID